MITWMVVSFVVWLGCAILGRTFFADVPGVVIPTVLGWTAVGSFALSVVSYGLLTYVVQCSWR